jgi:3'-phosphoadenosine 5'-phosphosulfate (PAPS) 3'-phosphatase
MLSELTPDQQVTIAGGGLWIVDPLDSTKNVARPSFAFRHAQQYFRQCLDKIEEAAAGTALSGPDAQAFVDFLKLLIRF